MTAANCSHPAPLQEDRITIRSASAEAPAADVWLHTFVPRTSMSNGGRAEGPAKLKINASTSFDRDVLWSTSGSVASRLWWSSRGTVAI